MVEGRGVRVVGIGMSLLLAASLAAAAPPDRPPAPPDLVEDAALSIVDGEVSTSPTPGAPFVPTLSVEQAPVQSEDDETMTRTFAVPAGGDLSGDGREDVLLVRSSWDDNEILGSEVEARSGADGTHLWRLRLGAGVRWSGYFPGDTTGDSRSDLALVTIEDVQVHASYPPEGVACFDCQKWVLTATTRLISVDGAAGEPVWEDQRVVSYTFNEQPVPRDGTLVRMWATTNLLSTLATTGDVDGDGADDLLWSPWESTFGHTTSTQTVPATMHSGRTGAVLWSVALVGSGSTAWNREAAVMAGAWPGPDGNGDGVADLYTSEIHETATTTVLVRRGLDGRTGVPFWVTEQRWPTDRRLLRGGYVALDGAGAPLVYTLTREGGFPIDVEALDPATGSLAWRHEAESTAFVAPVGNIDGDAAEDLVEVGVEGGELVLSAIASSEGRAVSERRLAIADWSTVVLFGPFVDHSGDGVTDLVVGRIRFGREVDETWTVSNLADGTELWSATRSGVETPTFFLPAGDLARRPAADLVAVRAYSFSSDAPRIELYGIDGVNGRTMWRRPAHRTAPAGAAAWRLSVANLTDVDHDRRADLLVGTDNVWGEFSGADVSPRIEILSGRKGRIHHQLVGS